MPVSPRKVALALFAVCALVAAGCGSKNKDKIVGKWKLDDAPGMKDDDKKMMEAFKMYPYMEFKADGTAALGVASENPEMQKMLQEKSGTSFPFKYKLGSGEKVEIFDLPKEMQDKGGGGMFGKKDRARATIKIEGNNMTIIDDDKQTARLTKVN